MTPSPISSSADIATPEFLQTLNAGVVSDAIKAVGCAVTAVEQDGVLRLHSASHGIGFQVLWGNPAGAGEYSDMTLSCPLRVQGGQLPDGVLSLWHRTKRFARVSQHGDFVVLEMDVVVAGGVTLAHVVLTMQLWTQMMGQFFLHLRNFKADEGAAAPQEEPAAA
ncbi:YbjN domain-containing protein [Variovorax ginsengisoli]|uniref:YbjN domain-containing protein n=1 Tax=Variovorax ginsengisoli TaxID=363844 RepID=A0ABT9SDL7_9BURK|nr:YbjN domain-containing protein [Variovorax ginsengisoli]MDP9902451.1 hypothetical protein [Variovorax ginsengisoli]